MLEELKTFIEVVELKNFTKAAERLNISQPTVSLHIKRLEDYFDEVFIVRGKKQKRLVITAAGTRMYRQAKKILNLWKSTYSYVRDELDAAAGNLIIGVTFTIGEYFLPEFLGEFNKSFPNIKVEVEIGNTQKISELLASYKINAAIVEGNIIDERFYKQHLYEDKLVVIVPRGHEQKKMEEERWIIREKGSGTRGQWEYLVGSNLKELKYKPLVLNSNFAVKEAVRNGLGAALISEYIALGAVANGELTISREQLKGRRFFDLLLAKDGMHDKALEIFCQKISEFFQNKGKIMRKAENFQKSNEKNLLIEDVVKD